MMQSKMRYCKLQAKEELSISMTERENDQEHTRFRHGKRAADKDTIHNKIELFFNAPRNPIIDLNRYKITH